MIFLGKGCLKKVSKYWKIFLHSRRKFPLIFHFSQSRWWQGVYLCECFLEYFWTILNMFEYIQKCSKMFNNSNLCTTPIYVKLHRFNYFWNINFNLSLISANLVDDKEYTYVKHSWIFLNTFEHVWIYSKMFKYV